ESGRAVYELNHGHHHDHLVCLDCGRVVEFFEPELETLQDRIAERHGFAIEDHALYLYAKCQKVNCEHRNLETEP
ncbi:MAG: transcriptional repressor, partial [Microvirgula sp.]